MKRRRLGAGGLKLLAVRAEQLRERMRHLIGGRGRDAGRGARRRRSGLSSVEPIPAKFSAAAVTMSGAITNDMVVAPDLIDAFKRVRGGYPRSRYLTPV